MIELTDLPGNQPWVSGCAVELGSPKVTGSTGPLVSPVGCVGTYTPQFSQGHWSVDCGGESVTKELLHQYGKVARDLGAIFPNPLYVGG